jgi:hypothetical protein
LFGKPTPLKAAVSFHTIIVREQQKLTAWLGGKEARPDQAEEQTR